mgnify:CR=1 FL=1
MDLPSEMSEDEFTEFLEEEFPEEFPDFSSDITDIASDITSDICWGLEELRDVIMIGATNRPDLIDPALLRPGRFDRLLYIPPPGKDERRTIFDIHTSKKPLADDVNLDRLAGITDGYTGADIASIADAAVMNGIKRHLAKYGNDEDAKKNAELLLVSMDDFESAMKRVRPISQQEISRYQNVAERFTSDSSRKVQPAFVS